MENKKTQFVEGMYYNQPHEKAPDFVLGSIGINKEVFMAWLEKQPANAKGYINPIDVLLSKAGKPYLKVNDYQPQAKKVEPVTTPEGVPAVGTPATPPPNTKVAQDTQLPTVEYPEEEEINPDDIPF